MWEEGVKPVLTLPPVYPKCLSPELKQVTRYPCCHQDDLSSSLWCAGRGAGTCSLLFPASCSSWLWLTASSAAPISSCGSRSGQGRMRGESRERELVVVAETLAVGLVQLNVKGRIHGPCCNSTSSIQDGRNLWCQVYWLFLHCFYSLGYIWIRSAFLVMPRAPSSDTPEPLPPFFMAKTWPLLSTY